MSDIVLLISISSMAYERILDSVLWYTRVWNILYVACSYLTNVNVEVSGKTEMQRTGLNILPGVMNDDLFDYLNHGQLLVVLLHCIYAWAEVGASGLINIHFRLPNTSR